MSWNSKTDYCGLAVEGKIIIKSATQNKSGQYLEKPGTSSAICATKPFGAADAPSCDYAIKGAKSFGAGEIKLGAVTSITVGNVTKRYALASVRYENGADVEPTFTGTAQEIEATSDGTQRMFDVPAFDVSPDEAAEIIMSAATVGGTGCELTHCTMEASANIKIHTVNGVIVSSDVTVGHVVVSLEILQSGDEEPTVAPSSGWDISSPLTCTDPDADFPTWSCELSKPLAYTVVSGS